MSDNTDTPLREEMTIDKLKEIIRMSEAYIDGTLKISIAADGRAMQLSAMTAAASTALLVFGLTSLFSWDPPSITLSFACFISAAFFFMAHLSALSAAKPRAVAVPGTTLGNWGKEEREGDLRLALWGQAEHYDELANENLAILAQNAKRIKRALALLAAAPVAGATGAVAAYTNSSGMWSF
ncbi:hypothetical protein HFO38_30555 [Rhizobium leguminosarum]|uniref:hypothetical protein n=1 Tax=Rhizobium leguminosarum TaxID=384 RepID=UPI001C94EECE|nr:hypothetical protein [Rhizobium leguminosarum]MBY5706991.1 hypothetical protein [Rhizobium leguminosarum]